MVAVTHSQFNMVLLLQYFHITCKEQRTPCWYSSKNKRLSHIPLPYITDVVFFLPILDSLRSPSFLGLNTAYSLLHSLTAIYVRMHLTLQAEALSVFQDFILSVSFVVNSSKEVTVIIFSPLSLSPRDFPDPFMCSRMPKTSLGQEGLWKINKWSIVFFLCFLYFLATFFFHLPLALSKIVLKNHLFHKKFLQMMTNIHILTREIRYSKFLYNLYVFLIHTEFYCDCTNCEFHMKRKTTTELGIGFRNTLFCRVTGKCCVALFL